MTEHNRRRVLVGNVFFSPTSFGGATIVAENMALELKSRHNWDVIVVTSIDDPAIADYCIRRYTTLGIDVIGIKVPDSHFGSTDNWNNERFNRVFSKILDLVQPDIVHMHCLQNMGGACLESVKRRKIPLVTTVHDCWWLCERQFMINNKGRYCDQRIIDLDICRHCVDDIQVTRDRQKTLLKALNHSDLILFPSRFHRDLHIRNGLSDEKCVVNKNGVTPPGPLYSRQDQRDNPVRLGFVGGPGPIKGADVIQSALNSLPHTNYELMIVDAGATRNSSWKHDPTWQVPGKVTFLPPYNQKTIDDFFSKIDVLLFPSQWRESFGLTVREAMLRGVWTITSDAGGLAEDCIEGENSTVIPMTLDHRYLREALRSIFENGVPHVKSIEHISTISDQAEELDQMLASLIPIRTKADDEVPA